MNEEGLKTLRSIAKVIRTAVLEAEADPPAAAAFMMSALMLWSRGILKISHEQLIERMKDAPCPLTDEECTSFVTDVLQALLMQMSRSAP